MNLKEWYSSKEKKIIENLMLEIIAINTDVQIENILKKQIFPSKRIRSYFLYNLCKDVLDKNDFYTISVAIELFHQSTLIFDDVIDDTDIRDGGRIGLHNNLGGGVTGSGKADHIATILMLVAEKQLKELNDLGIFEEFIKMRLKMFKAQLVDVFVIKKSKNISHIDWMLNESYKKTSSFMEFPFFIYGIKLNKNCKNLNDLKIIGKNIGILYQIGDDLFDIDDGIKKGTLALTWSLAYILDNEKILNNDEKKFINKILKLKYLDEKDAKKLNFIYIKNRGEIESFSKKYFERYFLEIKNSNQIDLDTKNIIINLLQKVIDSKYWQYKV